MGTVGVARDELVALQQFCSLDRQLRRHADESKEEVRTVMRKKNECMAILLRTMQQRNIECLAINGLVEGSKYARILLSHTTRQITPTLVKEALTNHFQEVVEQWPSDATVEQVAALLYAAVRQDRTRTKPIVSFSNCLPRGVKAEHVMDAQSDSHVTKLVSKMHTLQVEYATVASSVREKRRELQACKAEHLPLVESFLTKREANTQMIVSKSGERLCLRRRAAHARATLSVAQFRGILENAVTKLVAQGVALEAVVDNRDALVDAVMESMDESRSIVTTHSIQVLYMKPKPI
jgi:hypothetical protein